MKKNVLLLLTMSVVSIPTFSQVDSTSVMSTVNVLGDVATQLIPHTQVGFIANSIITILSATIIPAIIHFFRNRKKNNE